MRKHTTLSKFQYELSLNSALKSTSEEYFLDFNSETSILGIKKKLLDDDMKVNLI